MLRYEILFVTVPEITADESSAIESQLEKAVSGSEGTLLSYERWGKYSLAYPIRKYDYGVYFLMRFDIKDENKQTLLENLRTIFAVKYTDLVMRYIIISLNPNGTLDYKRPESLEEVPTRDVDTFLKENKMSGLLGKGSNAHSDLDLDTDLDSDVENLERI